MPFPLIVTDKVSPLSPEDGEIQLIDCEKTLEGIKSKSSSSSEAASILNNYLIS